MRSRPIMDLMGLIKPYPFSAEYMVLPASVGFFCASMETLVHPAIVGDDCTLKSYR